jgi:predicted nucleic acid-binding protein
MHNAKSIVINTGPIIALVAALGDLTVLKHLYKDVLVPFEVSSEILQGGQSSFAVKEFNDATWLVKHNAPQKISPFLSQTLDVGEAAVVQLALQSNISTVCIDEAVGRRVARLNELKLTGSIGILIRAKKEGFPIVIRDAIQRMRSYGIWLSDGVVSFALEQVGEDR